MHACGHDGHTAAGLGLAHLLGQRRQELTGEVRLLFQPAEEGCRGARALGDQGWLEGADFFPWRTHRHRSGASGRNRGLHPWLSCYLQAGSSVQGPGVPRGQGAGKGEKRSAGGSGLHGERLRHLPERAGRRADQHREVYRGKRKKYHCRRGVSGGGNQRRYRRDQPVYERFSGTGGRASAAMYGVTCRILEQGEAGTAKSSPELIRICRKAAESVGLGGLYRETGSFQASEDAATLMERVQNAGRPGGLLYVRFPAGGGTPSAGI